MTNQNTATSIQKNSRILVAEDYEVNQKIAQLMLQKAGYHVDIVANGQQAIEAYKQNHYDLILMDIQMPLMDGHAATRAIREWESASAMHGSPGMQHINDKNPHTKSAIRNQKGSHNRHDR